MADSRDTHGKNKRFTGTDSITLPKGTSGERVASGASDKGKIRYNTTTNLSEYYDGNVWKAIVDLRQRNDLEIHTCFVDQGIGIIKKQINSSILKINKKTQDLKFSDFYHNHKEYLRIINLDEFKKIY